MMPAPPRLNQTNQPSRPSPSHPLAFNLSTGADTGGAAIRQIEAFDSPDPEVQAIRAQHGNWEVRAMVAADNYIAYPQDVPHSLARLESLYDSADVIHLNHTLHGHTWYDKNRHKPTILEHHGLHKGAFDIDFQGSIKAATAIGAIQIGSTANHELFGPITWAPIPYDLEALARLRQEVLARAAATKRPSAAHTHADGVLTIAHAPTNRAIKSTAAFIAALERMIDIGLPVRMLLIENRSHVDCLRLKATADIFVDQLQLGYGCNAIEAWGMGLPVVGGIADPTWHKHMQSRWGSMPLFEATDQTLARKLTALVLNPSLREEYAALGRAHVERWHTQAYHVALMSDIYASAKPTIDHPYIVPSHLTHAERLAILRANRAELKRQRDAAHPA